MVSRSASLLLASALMHLSAVAFLAQSDSAQRGFAGDGNAAGPPSTMSIVPVADMADESLSPAPHAAEAAMPDEPPAGTVMPATLPRYDTPTPPAEYLPRGKLTRAAHPLEEIDLNDASLGESGFEGEIELVLLIERDGRVGEVIVPAVDDRVAAFAERAAARFRAARFSPGEVDGRPVRSELRIKVVSERPVSSGRADHAATQR
jgi:hypothetical protein